MSKRERQPAAQPVDSDEPISKSERKRRAHRLQALGRRLAELRREELTELGLPQPLVAAIADYQRFPSHEAKRRQLQYIGRLMRDVDTEPLQTALDSLQGESAQARYEFHQLERWRERLLDEADTGALTAFVEAHPGVDVQQLRHHIQHTLDAPSEDRQRTAARALFRFLRDNAHPD